MQDLSFVFPLIAFVAAAVLIYFGRGWAMACGFADKPGGRKRHDVPVPPIGGLVILPVFIVVVLLAGLGQVVTWPLMAGVVALLVMGAIDDYRPVKPAVKFILMLTICFAVVVLDSAQIRDLGNLFGFGRVGTWFFAEIFTVLAIALLMNAVNMIDGVDGLAGGFCALVVFWMMMACAGAGQMHYVQVLAILLACILAFLAFNMRHPLRAHASVFMGDAGALALGLVLGWFCVKLTQQADAPLLPATVIWIIALPVMDAFGLYIARKALGLRPFKADRRHLHHRILDAGFTPAQTTFILLGMISLMALAGLAAQAHDVPEAALFWSWMVVFILHTAAQAHPRGYAHLSRVIQSRRAARAGTNREI